MKAKNVAGAEINLQINFAPQRLSQPQLSILGAAPEISRARS